MLDANLIRRTSPDVYLCSFVSSNTARQSHEIHPPPLPPPRCASRQLIRGYRTRQRPGILSYYDGNEKLIISQSASHTRADTRVRRNQAQLPSLPRDKSSGWPLGGERNRDKGAFENKVARRLREPSTGSRFSRRCFNRGEPRELEEFARSRISIRRIAETNGIFLVIRFGTNCGRPGRVPATVSLQESRSAFSLLSRAAGSSLSYVC